MTEPESPSPESIYLVGLRKVILLGLIAVVAALGLFILLQHLWIYFFSLLLSNIFVDAVMGLIGGFSVRWILRGQPAYMRILATSLFVFLGLELLGWFTGGLFGLRGFQSHQSGLMWLSLGQWLLAVGIGILPLFAWNHPVKDPPAAPGRENAPRRRKRPPKRHRPVPASRTAQPINGEVPPQQPLSPGLTPSTPPAKAKRKRAMHRKPQLHFSSEEEHRCPYCLELIEPDDPRGTVECKICHTLHHADCWAITGACQVPHFTK